MRLLNSRQKSISVVLLLHRKSKITLTLCLSFNQAVCGGTLSTALIFKTNNNKLENVTIVTTVSWWMRKGVFKSISAGWEIRTAPVCKYQVIGRKKLQLLIIVQTQEAMPNPAKPFFYSSNNLLENCSNYSESQIVLWNKWLSNKSSTNKIIIPLWSTDQF